MTSLVFDPAPSQPTCPSRPRWATVSQLSSRLQATPRPRVSLTGTQPVTQAQPGPARHSRLAPPPGLPLGGLSLSVTPGPAPPISHARPRHAPRPSLLATQPVTHARPARQSRWAPPSAPPPGLPHGDSACHFPAPPPGLPHGDSACHSGLAPPRPSLTSGPALRAP
jgi:hypothetical protein